MAPLRKREIGRKAHQFQLDPQPYFCQLLLDDLGSELRQPRLRHHVGDRRRPPARARGGVEGPSCEAHVFERRRPVEALPDEARIAAEHSGEDARLNHEVGPPEPAQLVAVDRRRDRSAHLDVVERRHLDVHAFAEQVARCLAKSELAPLRISRKTRRVELRQLAKYVDLAGLQLEALRDGVHAQRVYDAVEVRLVRSEIAFVAHERHAARGLPSAGGELERSRAARTPRVVEALSGALAHGAKRRHRERGEEGRVRLAQSNLDVVAPGRSHAREVLRFLFSIILKAFDAIVEAREGRGRFGVESALDAALDVARGELLAVVHEHASAQPKRVRAGVARNRVIFRQIGEYFARCVEVDEAGVDHLKQLGVEGAGRRGRVERLQIEGRREMKHAAANGRIELGMRGRNGGREGLVASTQKKEGQSAKSSDRAHREAPPQRG